MSAVGDVYAGAAEGWANGATIVYQPIAEQLVAHAPSPLDGARVLDAGAGTGVVSDVLARRGARTVAADLSFDMLTWEQANRPPSAVADVTQLPLRAGSFDGVVASFVLNHLSDPVAGLRELRRVLHRDGWVLATTYADKPNEARDAIDREARQWGMAMPDWYLRLKTETMPLLASADRMADAAARAGLRGVDVEEVEVDVGVDTPEALVAYRLGQANYAEFLAGLDTGTAARFRAAAIETVRPIMQRYRPLIVILHARR